MCVCVVCVWCVVCVCVVCGVCGMCVCVYVCMCVCVLREVNDLINVMMRLITIVSKKRIYIYFTIFLMFLYACLYITFSKYY